MLKQTSAILFSEMTPDPSWEDEFNEWYDQEHIPLRIAVPGFRSAQRYRAGGTRNYLVIYEMDSVAVLKSPAYLAVKNNPSDRTRRMLSSVTGFTRYVAEETDYHIEAMDAPVLYPVFFEIPPPRENEFNDSHEKDDLMVRRFKIVDGEPKSWTHLALHYLSDVHALETRYVFHKYGSRK